MENNNKKTLYKFVDEEMQRTYWANKMNDLLVEQINPLIDLLKFCSDEEQRNKIIIKLKELIGEFCECENEVAKVNNGCSHDIILHLGNANENYGYGECIMCKGKFHLENANVPNREYPENIIEFDDVIPKKLIYSYDGRENVLVRKARAKLIELAAENENITVEEARHIVLADLICYSEELCETKVNPRSRKKFGF